MSEAIAAIAGVWLYSIAVVLVGFYISRRRDRALNAARADWAPPSLAGLAIAVVTAPIFVLAIVWVFAWNQKEQTS